MGKFAKVYDFGDNQILIHRIYDEDIQQDDYDEYMIQIVTEFDGKQVVQNVSGNRKNIMDNLFKDFNRAAAYDFLMTVKQSSAKGDADTLLN